MRFSGLALRGGGAPDAGAGHVKRIGLMSPRMLHAGVSLVMGLLSFDCYNKYPEDSARSMQQRAALALATCSGLHLFRAAVGIPGWLRERTPHPQVALHCLGEFVTHPLMIANVGQLAGICPRVLLHCIGSMMFSTGCFLGAGVVSGRRRQLACLTLGCVVMRNAMRAIRRLPKAALRISKQNFIRCRTTGDQMLLGWSVCPFFQALGVLIPLKEDSVAGVLALTDLFIKSAVMHLTLQSRSAVRLSAHYLNSRGGGTTTARGQRSARRSTVG